MNQLTKSQKLSFPLIMLKHCWGVEYILVRQFWDNSAFETIAVNTLICLKIEETGARDLQALHWEESGKGEIYLLFSTIAGKTVGKEHQQCGKVHWRISRLKKGLSAFWSSCRNFDCKISHCGNWKVGNEHVALVWSGLNYI